MTNRELDQQMGNQLSIERKAGREILRLIVLAEKQRLCGELGYKDLADWLIRRHKVSERTAYRKLKAAKLSMDVPEVLEKIERGQLSVTALSQVQTAILAHEKFTSRELSAQEKSEVVQKIEGLKSYDTERMLISLFPETASEVKQDRTTVVTENISRLSINLPNETLELILRAKETGIVCGSTHQVEIDHIKPSAIGGTDDPSNLRCLCRRPNLYMAEKNLGKKANAWKTS